jgi:hypothetical protein
MFFSNKSLQSRLLLNFRSTFLKPDEIFFNGVHVTTIVWPILFECRVKALDRLDSLISGCNDILFDLLNKFVNTLKNWISDVHAFDFVSNGCTIH